MDNILSAGQILTATEIIGFFAVDSSKKYQGFSSSLVQTDR